MNPIKNSIDPINGTSSGLRYISIYLISILGVFSLGIFIFSAWVNSLSESVHEDYRNIMLLRSKVFENAYKMGEFLSGDLVGDPYRAMKHLDEATNIIDELLACATPDFNPLGLCVMTTPEARAELEKVNSLLSRIKSTTYKRVMSPESSHEGSQIDTEFDQAMAEFEETTNTLTQSLNRAFKNSEQTLERVNWALGLSWILVISISIVTMRRRETQSIVASNKLRISEEKYRSLIDATQTGFAVVDIDGRIKDANPEFLALVGNRSIEDIVNLKLSNWTVEPDSTKLAQALATLTDGEARIKSMDITFIRSDRSSVPIELNASMVQTPDGPMVFCLLHDDTVRKRAQEEILRAQSNLEAVIANSPLPIVGFGRFGEITLWSPAAELVFGWRQDDIIGRTAPIIHPESTEQFDAAMADVFTGRSVTGFECTGIHRDGSRLMLSFAASPLFNSEGKLSGAIALFENVAERKIIEERLMSAVREKDVLLQEIHHRVKNNMQIITSMLKLQAANISDQSTIDVLTESRNRIRAMSLVHDKLYGSRDISQIDIREYTTLIAKSLLQSYGTTSDSIGISIETEGIFFGIDMAIPYGLVLNELLTNCIKHAFPNGREGEIRISLSTTPERIFNLTIEDTGVGLPAQFRIDSGDSFGLKLVRSIVESQLKGTIKAEPIDGGSRFSVVFNELSYKKRF